MVLTSSHGKGDGPVLTPDEINIHFPFLHYGWAGLRGLPLVWRRSCHTSLIQRYLTKEQLGKSFPQLFSYVKLAISVERLRISSLARKI